MCTTTVYTYVRPDGRREQVSTPQLCSASRHGKVCAANTTFQYPYETPLAPGQAPPTPTYTPRSSTPNYRSGDESDRSYHSASSSSRNKRPAGVYINGQKVLNLNKRSSRRSGERIVLVDSPPTPRTPPQTYTAPHTAPSSPNFEAAATAAPYIYDAAPGQPTRRSSMSHHRPSQRPVIVDERPRGQPIQIEVRDARHGRHASSSSRDHSSSSVEDEERRRRHRRRQEKEEQRQREEEEIRRQRMLERIAKANAEISSRPPVPMPPSPPRRSSTYARPAVEVPYDRDAELAEAVRRMDIRDEQARRAARTAAEREEEEAQRLRLLERMMPRRRATVGPGSRRHRVLYDDGVYRWE